MSLPLPFKSCAAGVASGVLTYVASIYALGYTNALVMPRGVALAAWEATAVFGLGAALVALLIHFFAIQALAARILPALAGFVATVVSALAATGQLASGGKAIAAWLIGVLLASAAYGLLKSHNAFKPRSLRGSA